MLHAAILFGVFLTVVCMFLGIYQIVFSSRLTVLGRLDTSIKVTEGDYEAATAASRGMRGEMLKILGMLGRLFQRRVYFESIQKRLNQAHIYLRAEELVGLSIVCASAAFLLLLLLTNGVLLPVLAAVIAYMMPGIYVNSKKSKRARQLNSQLPEALGIIANGLRAGYSFPQAMDVVSREMAPPISEEFGRVIRENRLGKPMEDTLDALNSRADDEDMDIFVTALLIQRQVGGNLAEVLNKIEHTIRERVRIKGEINTLTAQQKLSALIIVLLPFAVGIFLTLINPGYFTVLIEETIGWVMIGGGLFLQVVGILLIRKMIQIEV